MFSGFLNLADTNPPFWLYLLLLLYIRCSMQHLHIMPITMHIIKLHVLLTIMTCPIVLPSKNLCKSTGFNISELQWHTQLCHHVSLRCWSQRCVTSMQLAMHNPSHLSAYKQNLILPGSSCFYITKLHVLSFKSCSNLSFLLKTFSTIMITTNIKDHLRIIHNHLGVDNSHLQGVILVLSSSCKAGPSSAQQLSHNPNDSTQPHQPRHHAPGHNHFSF